MKIIVLGDIHGNLPALEVVLREARAEGYDLLCHTGDLVGYAPYPEETVSLVRSAKIPGVRGDIDHRIAGEAEGPGVGGDPVSRPFEEKAFAWTLLHTEKLTRSFLGNLPFERRIETGGRRAVLLHATPIDLDRCLWESMDEDYFREMGEVAEADIIIFGHTHRPYHRKVDGRHFVNVGSVGYPRDGNPRTGYAVIKTDGDVEVRYHRFPYDTDRLLRAASARQFPQEAMAVFKA